MKINYIGDIKMIKTLLSYILYYIGDFFSKIAHWKWTADMYQWCMRKSLDYDMNEKVWKKQK